MSSQEALDKASPPIPSRSSHCPAWMPSVARACALGLVLWAAHYWLSARFGLYEDDYTRIPASLQMNGQELVETVRGGLSFLSDSGKPLHSPLIFVLAFLAGKPAGLQSLYWAGFGMAWLNAILLFLLLRRVSSEGIAFLGAIAFCLSPADTTQAFLTHSFGLQPALTFMLLGFHAYLSSRRLLAYLLVIASLLTYEALFPLFLAAPLLADRGGKRLPRRLLVNAFCLALVLAGVAGIRAAVGEGRIAGLELGQALVTSITHMVQGPVVNIGTFVYRPVQTIVSGEVSVAVGVLAAVPLFWAALRSIPVEALDEIREWAGRARGTAALREMPGHLRLTLWLGLAGLALLVLGYSMTFTVRAYALSGRDTRVHFAAVMGASTLVGCLAYLGLVLARLLRKRLLAELSLAGLFSLLLGFGIVVQRDYVRSWELQRAFWREVLVLCPDLDAGTTILVEPEALTDTRHIGANTWALPRVLNQVFVFPVEWEKPPRIYRLAEGWQDLILDSEGMFLLNAATVVAPPSLYGAVEPGRTILLTGQSGDRMRRVEGIEIAGVSIALKPAGPGSVLEFEPGPLHMYLDEAD